MILELLPENHELLSTKLEPFDFETGDAKELRTNLIESMKYYGGVGLAANQVGINARAFSMIHEEQFMIIINPEIIAVTDEKIKLEEGCLSFKGLYPKVIRPQGVSAKYKDENGDDLMLALTGLSARIFLHEYDHLNGITFKDRAGRVDMSDAMRKRKINLRRMKNGS